MDLYLFCLARKADVVAFTSAPDSDRLPRGNTEDAWRFLRQFTEGETLPTGVPLYTINEQISRYGYCIIHSAA